MTGAYNLILIIACYFTVNGIYIPAMPQVADYFQVSHESARASITYFQFGALLSCIAAGSIADFIGKKRYLLTGLFIAILGSFICLFADNLNILLLGRFLQGIGSATGFMLGFALAVDLYKPHETLKIIALNGIIVSIVSVFIPYLGGVITRIWDWRATFIFIIILFVIAFINSIIFLRKMKRIPQKLDFKKGMFDYLTLLTNKNYVSYAFLNAIFFIPLLFSLSYLPFYYKHTLNLEGDHIGIIIGLSIWLPFGLSSISSVKLYDRYGIDKSIYIGLFISFLSAIFLCFSTILYPLNLLLNIAGIASYFVGFGLIYSGSISQSMSIFMNLTTKASSLRTILLALFGFIGGWSAQNVNDSMLPYLALSFIFPAILSLIVFSLRQKKI